MSKRGVLIRLIAVALLSGVFAFGSFYLFKKQQAQVNFLSFQLEDESRSFLVNDFQKLVSKTDAISCVNDLKIDSTFVTGFELFFNASIDFHQEGLNSFMFSTLGEDFILALKAEQSKEEITVLLQEKIGLDCSLENETLTVGNNEYLITRTEGFLQISNVDFTPKATEKDIEFSSADIVEFSSVFPSGKKHILSQGMKYGVWSEECKALKGRPVSSQAFVSVAPAKFTALSFYGSSRMSEDNSRFFPKGNSQSFDWLGDGLLLCTLDSFEIIIARPNSERDLGLILEEQTLSKQADSVLVPYFNIGKFKVLPFNTAFNWEESIPELNSKLSYYTEYNNFNILANSIPAMRWYLGQVQLGNLVGGDDELFQLYQKTAPTVSHFMNIHVDEESFKNRTEVFQKNNQKLISQVTLNSSSSTIKGVEIIHEFSVDFPVENIQIIESNGEELVLLSNSSIAQLATKSGEVLWRKSLNSPLVSLIQVVDFENDGTKELVLFQKKKVNVLSISGESKSGFPIQLQSDSKAGLAVNYDMQFIYRIIVNVADDIVVYNEEGKVVEGWMFEGMTGSLNSDIYHVLTAGKDIIAFKDENENQFILNRRGESRLLNSVAFSLENETDFVVGGMESSLRKMGYSEGYIQNYYVLDGEKDSVKIDQSVAPITVHWEYNNGNPLLILEESNRLLIIDQFGYVKSEVLKPSQTNNFVGLVGNKEYGFVFSDISQNTIYLLNNYGKMLLPNSVQGSSVCTIDGNLLYTVSGLTLKAYKIKD